MPYISFMDLLGIKSIATYSPQAYHDKIKRFQDLLKYYEDNILKCNHKLIAFSDCAYVQCESLCELISFFQKLRQELMLREIFFNAAVIEGDLELSYHSNGEGTDIKSSFTMFNSPSTVKVYSKQNSFTGIGVSVDGLPEADKKI